MKAIYFEDINKTKFIDTEEVKITKPDEVKVRVLYTGICGSEVLGLRGNHPTRKPPIISGHEASGVVVEVGENVKNFAPGDKVAIEPQYGCGKCVDCARGFYNVCPNKKILGTIFWQGSYGEYVIVPESTLLNVPEGISMEQAALLEPLAVGFHAVDLASPKPEDTAVIIGCGPIGIATLYGCKNKGIHRILSTDLIDYNLAVAKQAGASFISNSENEDSVKAVMDYTNGEGADIVFIAAGAPDALDKAVSMVKRKGKIVIIAHFGKNVTWDAKAFRYKEALVYGTFMYTRKDYIDVLSAMQEKRIDTNLMITEIYPAEQCEQVFNDILAHSFDYVKILFSFGEYHG